MTSRYLRTLRCASWIVLAAGLLSACGGGGGGGGGGGQPPTGNVTVSGRITFDRLPFAAQVGDGLRANAPVEAPARQVVVEAVNATTAATLASTTTDTNGDYSLSVPAGTSVFIRARARMLKTGAPPTWDFSVRNNTNGDALYALQGDPFNSGSANSTRNLRAPSGWGTTSYTAERAAAPFAILDTVFRAKELILAAAANTSFPALQLFWSEENRTASPFCPDQGNIGTSSYVVFPQGATDQCNPPTPGATGIYVLGDFAGGSGDTDEFDPHVIAHEFGHYVEDQFSRSDSIGGPHGPAQRLDLRLAFGEGWGNAFAGMTLADPVYRDSFSGVDLDGGFDLEEDETLAEGWFSEFSVGELLWDVFDPANEPADAVALGFGPIYAVMTGRQVATEALTSIFPFATALRAENAAAAGAIDDLLNGEQIFGEDDFAANESNDGGDPEVLDIYESIVLGETKTVCSRSPDGNAGGNKLGNRVLLRFANSATRLVTITANGMQPNALSVAATDPDIFVIRQGSVVAFANGEAVGTETIPQTSLVAATYVIEVYDFDVAGASPSPRCMTVSITGS